MKCERIETTEPKVITEEIIESTINNVLDAAIKHGKAGRKYQRLILLAADNPDDLREMDDWIKVGSDIVSGSGKYTKLSKSFRNITIAGAIVGGCYGIYKYLKYRKNKKYKTIKGGHHNGESE